MRYMEPQIIETATTKTCRSKEYNFYFNKRNGFFMRCGKTLNDDPQFSPFGNEILDVQTPSICNGIADKNGVESPCHFCYQSRSKNGVNMSFETFKKILDLMPKTLVQVAINADAKAESNPDIWRMMEYARSKGIVPNITIAQVTDKNLDNLIQYCGAVAVSRYENKDICYDSVKALTDRGLAQCTIHQLVAAETYDQILETFNDYLTDERLKKLRAVVLLTLKRKGRGTNLKPMESWYFSKIVHYALDKQIPLGFDSCSCWKVMEILKDQPSSKVLNMLSEPCEAFCMSEFVDVNGHAYPCSFCSGTPGWEEGIDLLKCQTVEDLWNHPKALAFRKKLLDNNRKCPIYDI